MPETVQADLLITHAAELLTLAVGDPGTPRRGAALGNLGPAADGAVAALEGTIAAVGPTDHVARRVKMTADAVEIDAGGCLVTPGLIDSHTHPVFPTTREQEFEMRVLGISYEEIARAGGGIKNSVAMLRDTGEDDLFQRARGVATSMLRHGTTTAEAKSGYGLALDAEMMQLRVIDRINRDTPIDWRPTFLGAHEFPQEYDDRRDEYVRLLTDEMIPAVARSGLAEFCDVFFERGVYNREQTIAVMSAAQRAGMKLKFHVDEFCDSGGAALAVEMGAVSADHLVCVSDDGIRALAESNTIACLLPGTTYFLDLDRRPPVRHMIESGVAVAVATDYNPGSNATESMQIALNQACVLYKMSPAEAWTAATVNAAWAIDQGDWLGMLAEGLPADIVIWDAANHREVPYHYGTNLAKTVIKAGRVIA